LEPDNQAHENTRFFATVTIVTTVSIGAQMGAALALTNHLREHALPQATNDVSQITSEWRAGVDRLRSLPPPDDIRERDWHQWKLDAIALLDHHGDELAGLGWDAISLFGLHATHPGTRVGSSGLARFLRGGSLVEITATHAVIRRPTGSRLTFRRTPACPDTVTAWTLQPN
jgi:hypothetical protein